MPHLTGSLARARAGIVAGALVAVVTAGLAPAAIADPTPSAPPSGGETPSSTPSSTPTGTPSAGDASPSGTPTPDGSASPSASPSSPPKAAARYGTYAPGNGTYFNYPFGSSVSRSGIRTMVLRTIDSAEPGGFIEMSMYSFNDYGMRDALVRAVQRGVKVRVLANSHIVSGSKGDISKPFKSLQGWLGVYTGDGTWARVCSRSCRGTAGNHHDKMILVSSAAGVANITMMGSANMTSKAVDGQWNHMNVYSDASTFSAYHTVFAQSAFDRPVTPSQFQVFHTGINLATWAFPRPGTTVTTDPMMGYLRNVQCSGAAPGWGYGGRTTIRIGQYAWFDTRGLWLARQVRALWNAGCDVAVEYAIMGNAVKQVLYSPAGRGRIPMRQVATHTADGTIDAYDHAKWVAIIGRYGSNPRAAVTLTGTTNFTDLGFASDETTQVYTWTGTAQAYFNNFLTIWRSSKARVPSPTSALPGTINENRELTLGKGRYRNFDAD